MAPSAPVDSLSRALETRAWGGPRCSRRPREFAMAGNADKDVEQFHNFTRWSELFARDINR